MSFFKRKNNQQDINNSTEQLSNEDAKSTWARTHLGSLYDTWPKIDGAPEAPVFLKHCSALDMADEMFVNMLSAYGIPAIKQYPANGGFGKVVLGMSGEGVDIYIPASRLADALELIGGISDE